MSADDHAAEEKDVNRVTHHLTELEEAVRACVERSKRRRFSATEESPAPASKKHKKKKKKASQRDHGRAEPETQQQQHNEEKVEEAGAHDEQQQAGHVEEPVMSTPMEVEAPLSSPTNADISSEAVAGPRGPMIEEVEEETKGGAELEGQNAPASPETEGAEEQPNAGREEAEEREKEDEEEEEEEEESENSSLASDSQEQQSKFTIQVQKVADDVDHITKEVSALSADVQSLDQGQLPADPTEATELLRELRGRCAHFTDSLIRDMTVLDSLSLSEELRPVRKSQVCACLCNCLFVKMCKWVTVCK